MVFTDKQAQGKARQIFERFGRLIRQACAGTGIEESFLAGFTGVEAGIDRHGNISPTESRFEPGVYQDLISLRDNGYCFVGGKRMTNYSGVRQSQIADSDDAAIRALSTSYSFSQIMGWHCINNLKCTVAEIKDPDKHFGYTVKLLKIVGGIYMTRGDLTSVLHIWNTGNANGKTYHAAYVDNALLVKKHYESILAKRGYELDNAQTDSVSVPVDSNPTASSPTATVEPEKSDPPLIEQTPIMQNADTIVNTGDTAAVADGKDVTLSAPTKDGATATATKTTILGLAVPPFIVVAMETVKGLIKDGYVDAKEVANTVIQLILDNQKYVFMLIGIFILLLIVKKIVKQVTFWIEMLTHAIPGWNNIKVEKQ